jgi:hypothetical protein
MFVLAPLHERFANLFAPFELFVTVSVIVTGVSPPLPPPPVPAPVNAVFNNRFGEPVPDDDTLPETAFEVIAAETLDGDAFGELSR